MKTTPSDLAARIRERGLPEAVARIATEGGAAVHPVLEYRAESVWGPSRSVPESDLVPLWICGTTTAFARPDGTFVEWDAEEDEPARHFPGFTALVRALLTDLYEDEETDDARRAVATLLVPPEDVETALTPEPRD